MTRRRKTKEKREKSSGASFDEDQPLTSADEDQPPISGIELSRAFRKTIKRSGLYEHCEMFQNFADIYGGIRASGSPGYVASMDYVLAKLTDAGYNVYTTDVIADYFDEVLPPKLEGPIEYTSPSNDPMTYYTYPGSASGTVEALVYAVDVAYDPESLADTSTSGCETEDFVGFPAGSIALISRGTCSYTTKLENAVAAGASGVILTNEGTVETMEATGNRFRQNFPVPIIFGSSMLGMSILDAIETTGNIILKITTDVIAEQRINKNILAETDYGDKTKTIMTGAHLDSVFEGPGIQDNTSGCSSVLELALQFKKHGWDSPDVLKNKIRFAWWASEEYVLFFRDDLCYNLLVSLPSFVMFSHSMCILFPCLLRRWCRIGLLGSTQYVEGLSDEEIANIAMYLNMDMIGSPNFVRFLLDGDGSASTLEPIPQPGSPMAHIEATYMQYFDEVGLPVEQEPFSNSYQYTDHTPFYDVGIPVSDLHTGVDIEKTEAQAKIFGGEAGEPWDPCYHQACDTLENVNFVVMEQMARAAAHNLAIYGTTEGDLFA